MTTRHVAMVAALCAVLALRIIDPWHRNAPPAVAEPIRPSHSAATTPRYVAAASTDSVIRWPVRTRDDAELTDPFAIPAPPPPPAAVDVPAVATVQAAPPPPSAPPLPYTAIGDWTEDGVTVAFLAGPQGTVLARQDETLGGIYHVDQIIPGSIKLTYLPLHQSQQLSWRSNR